MLNPIRPASGGMGLKAAVASRALRRIEDPDVRSRPRAWRGEGLAPAGSSRHLDVVDVPVVLGEVAQRGGEDDEVAEGEPACAERRRQSGQGGDDALRALIERRREEGPQLVEHKGEARISPAYRLPHIDVVNGSATPNVTSFRRSGGSACSSSEIKCACSM